MNVIDEAKAKIKGRGLKLVMPEGEDARIQEAARLLRAEDLAEPVVFGAGDVPGVGPQHVAILRARREKMSDSMAERLLRKPLYRAGAAVAARGLPFVYNVTGVGDSSSGNVFDLQNGTYFVYSTVYFSPGLLQGKIPQVCVRLHGENFPT